MEKLFKIDDALYEKANPIINSSGLNLETVFNVCLNRIANERSVSFLFANYQVEVQRAESRSLGKNYNMTKSLARRFFEDKGYQLTDNYTFSSENRASRNFWMNPNFDVLKRDWYIVLNDISKRKLHLFKVPKNSLHGYEMTPRKDLRHQNLIDIQIAYNDVTFTDNRSHISFKRYYLDSLDY